MSVGHSRSTRGARGAHPGAPAVPVGRTRSTRGARGHTHSTRGASGHTRSTRGALEHTGSTRGDRYTHPEYPRCRWYTSVVEVALHYVNYCCSFKAPKQVPMVVVTCTQPT